jgi:hypothetical protein
MDEGAYTLYDARERVEGRTEWRLYYDSNIIGEHARPGDLLLLFRPDKDAPGLRALIAREGTAFERELRSALALRDERALRRFVKVEPEAPTFERAHEVALAVIAPVPAAPTEVIEAHPLIARAVTMGRVPSTRDMAAAAHDLVGERATVDPDHYMYRVLEEESNLFFAIERSVGQREVDAIIKQGGKYEDILRFALSKHQSRKARRGHSLQNHLEHLLIGYRIPHTAQCETENGEVPDFIIPGCREYHDVSYPAHHLRMVGCKSKIRERWPQYLKEAARIDVKYHFSVDPDLSDEVVRRMDAHGLRLFMPRAVLEAHYAGRDVANRIGTVAELINELRAVTVGV